MTQTLAPPDNGRSTIARRNTVMGSLAERYEMDPIKLLETLKATCIKGQSTNEQVQAFCIVANRYGLDPFLKEIHAFTSQGGGIVPIVGFDGWTHIVNGHDQFDGCEFEELEDEGGKPLTTTCTMYVKGRTHPIRVTERFKECYRNTPPWNGMPYRMLRHKAFMQTARIAFSISGIFDEDEAKDIISNNTVRSGNPAIERLNAVLNDDASPIKPPAQEPEPEQPAIDTSTVQEEAPQEPSDDAPPVAPAAEEAPQAPALEDLSDWGTFYELAGDAAQTQGKSPSEFEAGLKKSLLLAGKVGKNPYTTVDWRARHLAAMRDGTFSFETGKILKSPAAPP